MHELPVERRLRAAPADPQSPQRTSTRRKPTFFVPFLSGYFNFVAGYSLPRWRRRCARSCIPHGGAGRAVAARRSVTSSSSCGDRRGIVLGWERAIGRAVFVVAEGDREADYFRYGHDIVAPGSSMPPARRWRPAASRPTIGVFRGALTATLRDAEGAGAKKPNQLRRWLDELLSGEKDLSSGTSRRSTSTSSTTLGSASFRAATRRDAPLLRRRRPRLHPRRALRPRLLPVRAPPRLPRLLAQARRWAPRLAAELRATSAAALGASTPRRRVPAFSYNRAAAPTR